MERLFALSEKCYRSGIKVVLVYISEAHSDDGWPIGKEFNIGSFRTNCANYSDITTRLQRTATFVRESKCPFPVYADNETNELNVRL